MDLDDPWADPPRPQQSRASPQPEPEPEPSPPSPVAAPQPVPVPASVAVAVTAPAAETHDDPWGAATAASTEDYSANAWASPTHTPAFPPTWGDDSSPAPHTAHGQQAQEQGEGEEGNDEEEEEVEVQEVQVAVQQEPLKEAPTAGAIKSVFSTLFSSKRTNTDTPPPAPEPEPEPEQHTHTIHRRTDVQPVSLSAYVLGGDSSAAKTNDEPYAPAIAPARSAPAPPPASDTDQIRDQFAGAAQAAISGATNAAASAASAASAATAAAPSAVSRLWGRFSSTTAVSPSSAKPATTKEAQGKNTDWTAGLDALASGVGNVSVTEDKKTAGNLHSDNDDDVWDIFGKPGPSDAAAPASEREGTGSKKTNKTSEIVAGFLNFRIQRPAPGKGTGIFDDDDEEEEEDSHEYGQGQAQAQAQNRRITPPTRPRISSTARAGIERSNTVGSNKSRTRKRTQSSGDGNGRNEGDDAFAALDDAFVFSPTMTSGETLGSSAAAGGLPPPSPSTSSLRPKVGSGRGKGRYAFSRPTVSDSSGAASGAGMPSSNTTSNSLVEAYDVDAVEREVQSGRRRQPSSSAYWDADEEGALSGSGSRSAGVYRDDVVGQSTSKSTTRYVDQPRRLEKAAEDDDDDDDDDGERYGYAPGHPDAQSPSIAFQHQRPIIISQTLAQSQLAAATGAVAVAVAAAGAGAGVAGEVRRSGTPTRLPPPLPAPAPVGALNSSLGRSDSARRAVLPPPPGSMRSTTTTTKADIDTHGLAKGPVPLSSSSSSVLQQGGGGQQQQQQQQQQLLHTGDLFTSSLAPSLVPLRAGPASGAGVSLGAKTGTGTGTGTTLSKGTGLTADDLSFFEQL
ncbi:unnamed protein product [Tilletia laevis]|uniref:Uncharacterized protein n=2 Tax=Tilletia TaxID=13289 RepID=A0A177V5J2_9BASI|nr:hypothetical protein CF336_g2956 [Tilletia laevis]KAE8262055.1 hypothetical protein A4X03_0g2762 [Tilletia caries]CAD6889322.1 unnamed protein product [Tilletia caries]CAD6918770.1 unnamed protein product [Tilletia laevis]CAD6922436.1 unnamed protein product [Tilletia caries]